MNLLPQKSGNWSPLGLLYYKMYYNTISPNISDKTPLQSLQQSLQQPVGSIKQTTYKVHMKLCQNIYQYMN